MPDCKAFFACDADSHDGNGDMGWNPDGWPRCSEHSRPMKPIKVVALDGAVAFAAKLDGAIKTAEAALSKEAGESESAPHRIAGRCAHGEVERRSDGYERCELCGLVLKLPIDVLESE